VSSFFIFDRTCAMRGQLPRLTKWLNSENPEIKVFFDGERTKQLKRSWVSAVWVQALIVSAFFLMTNQRLRTSRKDTLQRYAKIQRQVWLHVVMRKTGAGRLNYIRLHRGGWVSRIIRILDCTCSAGLRPDTSDWCC